MLILIFSAIALGLVVYLLVFVSRNLEHDITFCYIAFEAKEIRPKDAIKTLLSHQKKLKRTCFAIIVIMVLGYGLSYGFAKRHEADLLAEIKEGVPQELSESENLSFWRLVAAFNEGILQEIESGEFQKKWKNRLREQAESSTQFTPQMLDASFYQALEHLKYAQDKIQELRSNFYQEEIRNKGFSD